MFLHMGENAIIPLKTVIAIMDYNLSNMAEETKEFLKISEDEGFVRKITDNEIKSFIIAEEGKKTIVYLSPISSVTLFKRTNNFLTYDR